MAPKSYIELCSGSLKIMNLSKQFSANWGRINNLSHTGIIKHMCYFSVRNNCEEGGDSKYMWKLLFTLLSRPPPPPAFLLYSSVSMLGPGWICILHCFPGGGSDGKESACNAGDRGSIPGSGRSPGCNGNPLQYLYLENPMDRGAWWAAVHGLAKSWTWLND